MAGQDPRAAQPEEQEQCKAPAAPAPVAGDPDAQPGGNGVRKREEWEGYSAAVLNDVLDG